MTRERRRLSGKLRDGGTGTPGDLGLEMAEMHLQRGNALCKDLFGTCAYVTSTIPFARFCTQMDYVKHLNLTPSPFLELHLILSWGGDSLLPSPGSWPDWPAERP